jgi:hypothetical protein
MTSLNSSNVGALVNFPPRMTLMASMILAKITDPVPAKILNRSDICSSVGCSGRADADDRDLLEQVRADDGG